MDAKKFVEVFGNEVVRGSTRESDGFLYRVLSLTFYPKIGEIDVGVKITDSKTSESSNVLIRFNFGVKGELRSPELQRE